MDELLVRPGAEEQEREEEEERKEREAFKEYEKRRTKTQEEKARIEADTEHLQKSNKDLKSCVEVNKKRRRDFEANLKKEDIKKIIDESDFEVGSRHQDFYGSTEKYNKLYFTNFSHIVSTAQGDEIRRMLKTKYKLYSGKDNEYLERVMVPDCIILLWAQAHQMSKAAAEKQLRSTLADIEISSPSSDEAAEVAREERQRRRKEEDNAERQRKARKTKKMFAKEKEPKARLYPEEKRVFKFFESDKADKRVGEVEKKKKEKDEEKKKKEEKKRLLVEERYAGERKPQPRRSRVLTGQKPR